jgi:hypothetical protein
MIGAGKAHDDLTPASEGMRKLRRECWVLVRSLMLFQPMRDEKAEERMMGAGVVCDDVDPAS